MLLLNTLISGGEGVAAQWTGALATAYYHILALLAREDDKMPIVRPAFHLLAFRQPLLYMD